MRVLLHICCGPCSIYCINSIRKKNHTPEGLFYNPNIYPQLEHDKRKEAAVAVSEKLEFRLHFLKDADLEFIIPKKEPKERCPLCWQDRLKAAASFAKENNFDAFTTTLLISPYQDHEKLKEIGLDIQRDCGVNFYYEDFRIGFRESHNQSRQMGLYHQKYCGCEYSERERYKNNDKCQIPNDK